jgi:hypothetical protein
MIQGPLLAIQKLTQIFEVTDPGERQIDSWRMASESVRFLVVIHVWSEPCTPTAYRQSRTAVF